MTKRRITRRLATFKCDYPCEHRGHEFEYAVATRPPKYCPNHEKGYIDPATGRRHGGRRNTGPDGDGGRRLTVEQKVTHYEFVKNKPKSVNGQLWRSFKELGIRAYLGSLLDWRPLGRVRRPGPGVVVTTEVAATGKNGWLRWNKRLWRSLTVEQVTLDPKGLLSLDMEVGVDGDGDTVTLQNFIGEDDIRRPDPDLVDNDELDRMQDLVSHMDPATQLLAEAQVRNLLVRLHNDPEADVPSELLGLLLRVSAVQDSEGGPNRTEQENQ